MVLLNGAGWKNVYSSGHCDLMNADARKATSYNGLCADVEPGLQQVDNMVSFGFC